MLHCLIHVCTQVNEELRSKLSSPQQTTPLKSDQIVQEWVEPRSCDEVASSVGSTEYNSALMLDIHCLIYSNILIL